MVQYEFEPSLARLFLMVEFGVIHNVSVLYLSPMNAKLAFEKMLPSDVVLGVGESSKGWFSIVGIHLEVLVREGASNSS